MTSSLRRRSPGSEALNRWTPDFFMDRGPLLLRAAEAGGGDLHVGPGPRLPELLIGLHRLVRLSAPAEALGQPVKGPAVVGELGEVFPVGLLRLLDLAGLEEQGAQGVGG